MSRWLCLGLLMSLPIHAAVDEACMDRCVADGYQPEHCAKDCSVPDATAPVPPPPPRALPPLPAPTPAVVPVPPPAADAPVAAGSAEARDAMAPGNVLPAPPQGSARPAETARVSISEAVKLGRDPTAPALYRDLAGAMAPRANAFPGFERVITNSAVEITPAMIQAIARSDYAADIIYYLTWNEQRAQHIAKLPVEQVPAAIAELEQRLKPRSST